MQPKKLGRPAGQKNAPGHRAGRPGGYDVETAVFVARCRLMPRQYYPGDKALYLVMGVGPRAFAYRLAGTRAFTAEQLVLGNALLDAMTP